MKVIMKPTIAIASDHAGLELKKQLASYVELLGHEVRNLGTDETDSVDYPDFANAVAEEISSKRAGLGILICGSGIGMSMAANRHKAIRAALVHSGLEARLARQHNHANVLCLGARIIGIETAKDCVKEFLNAVFEGGRHQKRIDKMS
jgi:ribose 5-phosphate isomerase B